MGGRSAPENWIPSQAGAAVAFPNDLAQSGCRHGAGNEYEVDGMMQLRGTSALDQGRHRSAVHESYGENLARAVLWGKSSGNAALLPATQPK